ncbi:acyl-CoA N-acyltransferase [Lasiosphaeria miniovina]|uniref:Acyl-CoA N-acyltransferase n=1 Tax=Lasiosphaeria miniovina TaxID=1954250 RepID=A0AA39ZUK8_9PEZI|nr:acyl-CoA N-acyltransferase [Lasiosphaeria miniovina]KAK0703810.1 acyl-CoA N-acyltransferase [Lasiosphaeria miniovina]
MTKEWGLGKRVVCVYQSRGAETETENLKDLILPLRDASRKLVREWGFLRPRLAGSALSPAAVHCLIEIGDHNVRVFSHLCAELKMSPSHLRRTVAELVARDHITVESREKHPSAGEQDNTIYCLTLAGAKTLGEINTYAETQVAQALATAPPGTGTALITAFRVYAAALEVSRRDSTATSPGLLPSTPEQTPRASPEPTLGLRSPPPPAAAVTIVPGYLPGILGRLLEMHMAYYSREYNWGSVFEAGLGAAMSNLLTRLDHPRTQAWSAVQGGRIVGTVAIDGQYPGYDPDVARVRAFIVDESTRGLGVGRKLMAAAMQFLRDVGFRECRLSTMRSLTVARAMYEKEGFRIFSETWTNRFGNGHMEMEYLWRRDGGGGLEAEA